MLPQQDDADKEDRPRMLVDSMLGRLARWLRLMGYDTEYWREGSDEALIGRARAEGRLIVTRDRELAGRRGVVALLLKGEDLDLQIAEVRAVLGPSPAPYSRCSECNAALVDLPHDMAQGLVPPYVWQTQYVYRQCPNCRRIYWKGTHWPGLNARLEAAE